MVIWAWHNAVFIFILVIFELIGIQSLTAVRPNRELEPNRPNLIAENSRVRTTKENNRFLKLTFLKYWKLYLKPDYLIKNNRKPNGNQ